MAFVVPAGVDSRGRLVRPSHASKMEDYRCPSCKDPLIFKAGPIRVRHFAHEKSGTCTSETVTHHAAKLLIVQQINDGPRLQIRRKCRACFNHRPQTLDSAVDSAQVELRLANGRVVDVGLLSQGKPVMAIEVLVTHKAADMGLPWIEVQGKAVLKNPELLHPCKDRFPSFRCADCSAGLEARMAAVRERGIDLPPSPPYVYALHPCFKCRKDMVVYARDGRQPDRDDRWQNICPSCSTRLADFYLFGSSKSPFFGL